MSFPLDPLRLNVQVKIDGSWIDLVSSTLDEELGENNRLIGGVSITHGRSDEDSSPTPASTRLVLWNDDGWLTPDDPRSPWWFHTGGGWGLNCEMRAMVGTSVVIHGEVSQIDPTWPEGDISTDTDPGISVVSVTVSGILRRLSQRIKPLPSPLRRLASVPVNANQMAAYWPFEDGADSSSLAPGLPGKGQAASSLGFTLAADDESLPGSDPLPRLSSGESGSWSARVPYDGVVDGGWVVDVFMRYDATPELGAVSRFIDVLAEGDYTHWAVDVDVVPADGDDPDIPVLKIRAWDSAGDIQEDVSFEEFPEFFGVMNHLQFKVEAGNWSLMWEPVGGATSHTVSSSHGSAVGNPTLVSSAFADPTGDVTVGHLSVHSTSMITNWAIPADGGWNGERAGRRLIRLPGEVGAGPIGFAGDPDGTTRLGVQKSRSFLDLMFEAEDADGGLLFELPSLPLLGYRTRRSRYNPSPAMVFSAHTDGITNPFEPTQDDQAIVNDITVTRIDGSSRREVNQPSIDKVGTYDQSVSLSLHSELLNTLGHQARWRLHMGDNEKMRYPQLTVDFATAATPMGDLTQWLANVATVGRMVRITDLPPQHPTWPAQVDLIVQGWTLDLEPYNAVVTMNCSPAKPWVVGIWGVSKYNAKNSTLAYAIDATETTLHTSTPGVQWTTASGSFPFDLLIGGCEVVTALDADGADPQEFTVIRNVNGLGRAHDAGAEVSRYPTAIAGL